MQLLEAGMEVWLGNSRASPESAGHLTFSNDSSQFWDFSFHEIGFYDLAAMIDAALEISQRKQLHLIAYSEGASAALTLLSERPEYNAKMTSVNLLAPAAFMANSQFKLVALLFNKFRFILPMSVDQILINSNQLSKNSRKQLEHYQQLILSGQFRRFDHGPRRNMERYGSRDPPNYDLSKITRPVVLHYGGRDSTVHPKDVEHLSTQLPKETGVQLIEYDLLDHGDFSSRTEAASNVYPMVVEDIVAKSKQIEEVTVAKEALMSE